MDDKEKRVFQQISEIAGNYDVERIVLFGSRARRTHGEKSDIDIAIYGCRQFRDLYFDLNENLWTLLKLDIVDMENPEISKDLIQEIERDGVTIYEKI